MPPRTIEPDRPIPRPRQFRPALDDMPLAWAAGDRATSHTIDAFSLLLPDGEAWFVEVLREALPLLEGHPCLPAVRGFMGQEAVHGRAHDAVRDHLTRHGIDHEPFARRLRWLIGTVFGRAPFGRTLGPAADRAWLVQRVGFIAAIEQLTTVLGEWMLANDELDRAGADPRMMALLRWHAAEEVEHRTVAYEAHVALGGGFAGRALGMAIAAPTIFGLWYLGARLIVREARRVTQDGPTTAAVGPFLRRGREGLLPTAVTLLGGVVRYLRPGHRPEREGTDARAQAYLAAAFGVRKAA